MASSIPGLFRNATSELDSVLMGLWRIGLLCFHFCLLADGGKFQSEPMIPLKKRAALQMVHCAGAVSPAG